MTLILRFLTSPANWLGLLLAIAVLVAKGVGIIAAYWLPMALIAYVIGYQLGVMLFGAPKLRDAWQDDLLQTVDINADWATIREKLDLIKDLARSQAGNQLSGNLSRQLGTLCEKIDALLMRMAESEGLISLEDSYSTRRLAMEYLPGLVHGYLTLPRDYASKHVLESGKTAEQLFDQNLTVLTQKVDQLTEDLSARDAAAFLSHTKFLSDKYGAQGNPLA